MIPISRKARFASEQIPEPSSLLRQRRSAPAHSKALLELGVLPAQVDACDGRHSDGHGSGGEIDEKCCQVSGLRVVEVRCPD